MNNRTKMLAGRLYGFSVGASLIAGVSVVEAAEGESARNSTALEEIVVTAQKRVEKLQDVPISISVMSGEDLDRSTARDITEMLRRVPGVTPIESYGGISMIQVRGVGVNATINRGSSPAAYYLDGAPFGFVKQAFTPDPDAYDLERVEVLRGPQGTLYGASALNGVVRVLSKNANLDEFELKARALTSNTKGGGWNYRGDMAVNVPIVEGKLAARATLGYQDLDGWIDKPNLGKNGFNDAQRSIGRLKLDAQPTDALSIGVSAWLSRADYGGPSVGMDRDGRYVSLTTLDEPLSTDYDVYGLKVAYDFSGFTLTSMTSYLEYTQHSFNDSGERGVSALPYESIFEADTLSEEITLTSTHEGPWRWSAGVFYRDSEDRIISYLPTRYPTTVEIEFNRSESYAVFGELTRLFADGQWEFTAGLRYFKDELTTKEISRLAASPLPLRTLDDGEFSATTPRFVLTWHPSAELTTYASYSEGFRSGFNQAWSVFTLFPPVEPDTLKNYELGAKGNLAGGRVQFEAALYYIDWEDIQLFSRLPSPTIPGLFTIGGFNGQSASGPGVDLAVTFKPVDALELGLNGSWNDLTHDAQVLDRGLVLFDKGDRNNLSAEYTVGASADYTFPLGNGFEGLFSVAANYSSELTNTYTDAVPSLITVSGDPILLARTSFSIRARDRWTASLFVENLNNERGLQLPGALPGSQSENQVLRPRTIGVQFDYSW